MENRLFIACCNLAIELRKKDFDELSKREKQFLNEFDRYSDNLLDKHRFTGGS